MKKQEKGVKAAPTPTQPTAQPPSSSSSTSAAASTKSGSTRSDTNNHHHGGGGGNISNASSGQPGALTFCNPIPASPKSARGTKVQGTFVVPATPTSNKAGGMGMKHSKSDHGGLGGSSGRKEKHHKDKEGKSSMGKKFISKSHENLSSGKKGKPLTTTVSSTAAATPTATASSSSGTAVVVVSESPRPRANAASTARAEAVAASERNKENLALKEREKNNAVVFIKPKPAKHGSGGSLRKASSTQSIDKTSNGLRPSSSLSSNSNSSSASLAAIKRAQSTQNICKDNKLTKKRTSAPADVMAYNAELLANFEKEKKVLEIRISELTKVAESRKGEIEKYKYEVRRLKDQVAASAGSQEEIEILQNENRQLNDRLLELGFPAEQATDAEKLLLKLSSLSTSVTTSGSAACKVPGSCSDINLTTSASTDSLSTDGLLGKGESLPITLIDGEQSSHLDADLRRSTSLSASEPGLSLHDLCPTPDHPSVLSLDAAVNWEKQSNKSANSDGGLSEVSVACLTERILQMEETNYSTTEELQATLQELGDLQDAVNELTEENGRLADEKTVLLESLCTQTEKLENTRIQLEQLKCLLISGELPDKSERDGHLLGLLKSAQEEREELMRKQIEWSNALQGLENECKEAQEAGEALRERYSFLEESNAALKGERELIEKQIQDLKEQHEAEKIEVQRLRALLETERGKVAEMESTRAASDRTELEALLDTTRQEKARAEEKVTGLSELLARTQCEAARLKDGLALREQELSLSRSNACQQAQELQLELGEAQKQRLEALEEVDNLRGHAEQLEHDCDKHADEKKSLSTKLHELQMELLHLRQQKLVVDQELQEISCKHDTESEEWRQFQKDLQMAVVIANNFSQETQEGMEQLSVDNAQLQEQVASLQSEAVKLRSELKAAKKLAEEHQQQQQHQLQTPTRGKLPSTTSSASILTNAELKGKVGKVLNSMMDRDHLVAAHLRSDGRSPLDQRSQSISVKSLIRSIEEQVKSGCSSVSIHSSRSESRRSSTSSDMSLTSLTKDLVVKSPTSPLPTPDSPRSPSKDFAMRASSLRAKPGERSPQQRMGVGVGAGPPTAASSLSSSATGAMGLGLSGSVESPGKTFGVSSRGGGGGNDVSPGDLVGKVNHPISSILKDRNTPRRNSAALDVDIMKKETPSKDPLASLAKLMKGSKRNALLKWCQLKTIPYSNVDITNFSSSWNDGLGFCALLHSYVPEKIPYAELTAEDKRKNFSLAFRVGEGVGIKSNLNINDMVCMERPDWQAVMSYVTSIYKHFELDKQ